MTKRGSKKKTKEGWKTNVTEKPKTDGGKTKGEEKKKGEMKKKGEEKKKGESKKRKRDKGCEESKIKYYSSNNNNNLSSSNNNNSSYSNNNNNNCSYSSSNNLSCSNNNNSYNNTGYLNYLHNHRNLPDYRTYRKCLLYNHNKAKYRIYLNSLNIQDLVQDNHNSDKVKDKALDK